MSVVLPLFSTASARLAADDDQAVRDIHGLLAGSWTDYEPGTGCMVIVVDDVSVWPGGCPGRLPRYPGDGAAGPDQGGAGCQCRDAAGGA